MFPQCGTAMGQLLQWREQNRLGARSHSGFQVRKACPWFRNGFRPCKTLNVNAT
jgi:hypothetical protein